MRHEARQGEQTQLDLICKSGQIFPFRERRPSAAMFAHSCVVSSVSVGTGNYLPFNLDRIEPIRFELSPSDIQNFLV